MSWTPLLRGDEARRADRMVDRLLAGGRGRGPSLALGDAGIALALAERAAMRGEDPISPRLVRALDALARQPMRPGLFEGFAGIAWVAARVLGEGAREIDAAVAAVARNPTAGHDLYAGLAGLGVYALDRPRAGLARIVGALGALGVRDRDGIAWETPVDSLPAGALPAGTKRHFNGGIAHGLPGVIAILALAHDRVAGAPALLDGAVRWLLAHRLADGGFPAWIDPGRAPPVPRAGWCYGDAAVARALWLAATAADEPAWRRIAFAVAKQAAAAPVGRGGAVDGGLCHGAAGLAHIFNRHWQATRDRAFADAARRWLRRALARVARVRGGWLTGRAGVALAIIAATTDREPAWDRALLLS